MVKANVLVVDNFSLLCTGVSVAAESMARDVWAVTEKIKD